MGGVKFDTGKPPAGMIPWRALREEAYVLAYGAKKYGRDNWKSGIGYSRLIDAALRHIYAFNDGQNEDPETGLSHLAHARANLGFLLEYLDTHPEFDDRYGIQA